MAARRRLTVFELGLCYVVCVFQSANTQGWRTTFAVVAVTNFPTQPWTYPECTQLHTDTHLSFHFCEDINNHIIVIIITSEMRILVLTLPDFMCLSFFAVHYLQMYNNLGYFTVSCLYILLYWTLIFDASVL